MQIVIAAIALLAGLAACAPVVDGPAERQRALDREDGARLSAQLAALPGVARAEAIVRRAARDPLAARDSAPAAPALAPTPAAPTAAIVLIVDDRADRAALERAALSLARAVVPGAAPVLIIEVGVARPTLGRVGPFTVESGSTGPLRAALGAALALIAALAAWTAYAARRYRRGNSAQ